MSGDRISANTVSLGHEGVDGLSRMESFGGELWSILYIRRGEILRGQTSLVLARIQVISVRAAYPDR